MEALEGLQGSWSTLVLYLAATWTLFAFGEEMGYRGYLLNRFEDLFGTTNSMSGTRSAIRGHALLANWMEQADDDTGAATLSDKSLDKNPQRGVRR